MARGKSKRAAESLPVAGASSILGTRTNALVYAALLATTIAAYAPAWNGGILWDDVAHLTRSDLSSLDGLRRIWFDVGATQQYYPIAHSAFWILNGLWGHETLGYHLVNIVLHATSALLLARILIALGVPGAVLAAFVFALHPVHVESVAWITELKNTLSGLFYLSAFLMFVRFDRTRARRPYAAALALFVLALLSKSVTATLPAALIVVFWWQRGRLRWRDDVVPLMPFFALGIASGLWTAWLERAQIGAEGAAFDFTLLDRVLIAGRALWFYLAKLVWPVDLVFVYPRWVIQADLWWQYLFPAGAAVVAAVLFAVRHRSRAPLAAFLLFAGTLFPALGFLNVYPFIYSFVADHFQYLASLAVIALFAGALATHLRYWKPIGSAVVAVLALLTWSQSHSYADAQTLYRHTLSRNPKAWLAHVNLGYEILGSGTAVDRAALEEAATHFRAALTLKPDLRQAHNNLGTVLLRLGRLEESFDAYAAALALKEDDAEVRHNLAVLLVEMRRYDEAVLHAREAIRLQADHAAAHANLGGALTGLGRFEEAAAAYAEAVRLNPGDADTRNNHGSVLGRLGRAEAAAAEFSAVLRLNPSSVEAHRNLAIALLRLDRGAEALTHLRECVRLSPESPQLRFELGVTLAGLGRTEEAATALRDALRLDPQFEAARQELARIGG
jgi:Flp pilus assembly protein TadD